MLKYLAIFNISWQNEFVYRLNFILWRFRMVLGLLMIYFIWTTIFQNQSRVFDYTKQTIVTYILVTALIRSIILSSRIMDVARHIHEGEIVNFLVKPLKIVEFYFVRDLADKSLNILFSLLEISLLIYFFKPSIIIQTNITTLILFIISILIGIIIFFSLGLIFGLLTFWLENIWAIYFLFFMLVEAFGGGLFPIDVLPVSISKMLFLTPFPYLLYFPAKVYLGSLGANQLMLGFTISIFWAFMSWLFMEKILTAGLKTYTAAGG